MEKPRKLTTRQYLGLVCDLNSRMAQLPPLFQQSQKIDESELFNSLANKAPRIHKAMLISQGFNTETEDLETFVEHCERAETTENIARAKFAASDEDSDTKKKKNRRNYREQSIGRRGLWYPWGCVWWRGAQMMMKLLSVISAIFVVLYGWEGSKINSIFRDLVGTDFWRQKPLVCTSYQEATRLCSYLKVSIQRPKI